MLARVERFEAKLNQSEVDAFLVTGQNNIYYLTGFWERQRLFLFLKVVGCL